MTRTLPDRATLTRAYLKAQADMTSMCMRAANLAAECEHMSAVEVLLAVGELTGDHAVLRAQVQFLGTLRERLDEH